MTDIKKGLGLTILLGSLGMFGPISIDLYLPALPSIGEALKTDAAGVQLTLASFYVGMALGQLFYGPLSDRFGRRPPLLIGILVFLATSIGCAFSTSIESLVGWRFLQALGACVGMVIARAVIADIYERAEAARMFSLLTLVFGIAPILAPLLGGLMLLVTDWRSLFLALALFGVSVLAATVLRLPETRSEQTSRRAAEESVWRSYWSVIVQRRLLGYALAGAAGGSTIFIFITAAPDLLMQTYGLAPHHFGLYFGLNTLGFVAATQVNRHLLLRFSVFTLLSRALVVAAMAALTMLLVLQYGAADLWSLTPPLFVLISSSGFILPNGVAGAMAVDLERSGVSSALVGSLQFVVASAGSYVLGLMHDGTGTPMAILMFTMLLLSLVCLAGLVRSKEVMETPS